ncbi:MAG TPA: hypothetical protein VEL47_02315 [Myxococcota bacterium]|nr:hypothetical protein [Myxococcota bacterium]
MKAYYRFASCAWFLVCGVSVSIYAADAPQAADDAALATASYGPVAENDAQVFVLKMDSKNPIKTYKNLRAALNTAIGEGDVAAIAALYLVAKTYQHHATAGAGISGAVAGVSLILIPFTFGLTTIIFLPSAAVCGGVSFGAHKYKELKRVAKRSLAGLVPRDIYSKITALKNFHKDGNRLQALLQQSGYEAHWPE